jgi:xanthine dehydrogenase accessory factor
MDDLFPHLEALGVKVRRAAMATLIATKGTTPKKEGAKMWVGEDGRVLGSVTIGGCVDARVIAESEEVLRADGPRRIKMSLGDEDAWELGLSCGGSVELLVEPLAFEGSLLVEQYRAIDATLQAGRGAVLVRLVDTPARALVVHDGGEASGGLGDAALDGLARERALALLARGGSTLEKLGEGDAAPEAFFEVHLPRPHLVLIGAGAVAMPFVPMARALGYRTTVIDPRPRFANPDRFPGVDEIKVGIASELIAATKLGPAASVVVTIHDYKVEVPVLAHVLRSGAGYVGMLGNRRRGEAVLQTLRERGFTEEELARVHVPIGLDLGARSAAEIALSVLAEIVAVRAGKATQSLRGAAK